MTTVSVQMKCPHCDFLSTNLNGINIHIGHKHKGLPLCEKPKKKRNTKPTLTIVTPECTTCGYEDCACDPGESPYSVGKPEEKPEIPAWNWRKSVPATNILITGECAPKANTLNVEATPYRPKLGKHEKYERMTAVRSGTVLPPNVDNPWFLTQCIARGQCTRMGCFNIHPWDKVMTARPREINA